MTYESDIEKGAMKPMAAPSTLRGSSTGTRTPTTRAGSCRSSVDKVEEGVQPTPEQAVLPEQLGSELSRKLRHKYASSYRKTFGVIFTANLSVFLAFMIQSRGSPNSRDVGSAASANLMVCILFRQEEFVNLVYEIFVRVPHSWPIYIRKRLAKVFHYGGCHSGAGTAAVVWYLLYTILATKEWIQDTQRDQLINMTTSWILPAEKYHDHFEAFHRFAGWTALITFWVHNIVSANVTARQWQTSLGHVLLISPNFWFICISTSCTIASWSRLRRREVYPEKLSDHATRLHLKYRGMQPFYGVKISDKPLTEWHAFATIPDVDPESGKITGFSIVVSNAGDFTKEQIMKPSERKIWVRGAPLHGLLYTSRLFKRIVVVATGSGIGPCLSLLFADVTPRRVLWSSRKPETTYGPQVVSQVKRADPNAVIWDTTAKGYPDIVRETYQLVHESDAEAVFIISNPKVTEKVVFGLQTRGIPAYGAIFDS
ncbi:Uu.00g076720.m01.CDS01 [Anthostomella pinea]|uniref:Uu.00g076720.m01.CDS01 n=1 Tax=Anthostomella pinea TaxID=933095 RepID=A0AAI8YLV5_9PEZI|nr:Uu.00g076720.m01.CDS01 [Anthostomella pinea]